MPLRILIVIGAFPPDHSGAGLRLQRTFARLSRREAIEVTALTMAGKGTPEGKTEHEGITSWRVPGKNSILRQFPSAWRELRRLRSSYDCLFISGSSPVSYAAGLYAGMVGCPVIREFSSSAMGFTDKGFLKMALLRQFFRRTVLAIALSQTIVNQYRDLGIPEALIWQRPNPIDTGFFRPPTNDERAAARRRFDLGLDDVVHVFIGRIRPTKNQLFALEVLALLPARHRLILAGPLLDVDRDYFERMERFIEANDLGERVVMLAQQRDDVRDLYHASDTCWSPSLIEGMPNLILESQCCGLPAVINKGLALDQLIEDGVNGFSVPLDAEAFASAVIETEKSLLREESRAAIATRAAGRFDAEIIDAEFVDRLRSAFPERFQESSLFT